MLEALSLKVQREIRIDGGREGYRTLPVFELPVHRAATRLQRAAGCRGACPGPRAACGSDGRAGSRLDGKWSWGVHRQLPFAEVETTLSTGL